MPGLSQYKPGNDNVNIIAVDPDMHRDEDIFAVDPSIFDRIKQRYEESLGFADLKRSVPGIMRDQMMRNIPRGAWNHKNIAETEGPREEILPGYWINQPQQTDPFTFREIMELLNQLEPNETQGP